MKQFNINLTPSFEQDLKFYMKAKKIGKKAEALRQALKEIVASLKHTSNFDFRSMLGAGLTAPLNPNPKFKNEDDLW